ncbi:MAG: carbohydrate-binding protein [Mahellales bacterium]
MKINDDVITVKPMPITLGSDVTIKYNGYLTQHNPDNIVMHVGYGRNDNWTHVTDVAMKPSQGVWEGKLNVKQHDSRLNICFKDNHQHWDNNNGNNWSFEIHNGIRGLFK